jgi:starch synthase
MNIVIDDIDHPLSIKVASISAARMQVYFIETEDYLHRKALYKDDAGNYFEDNDQRAIFFARGVLETVKKLRWKPDIIHCQGWISHLIPIYLKRVYNDDPIFADAKVVLSLFNECPDITFSENFKEHILHSNISNEDKAPISTATPNGTNLAQLAINYSDGVIIGNSSVEPELEKYAQDKGIVVISSPTIGIEETEYIKTYNSLYDQILED